MKTKLLLILFLVTVLVSGCNKMSEDKNLILGQEKLENHQYDEAMSLLSQVLDADPDNDSARSMYMQARKMESAAKYKDNYDYDKAINELNAIVNINNGSKKIKRESVNLKNELEKLQKQAEKEALDRKANAKKTSKQDINRFESEIIYNDEKEEDKKEEAENKEENNKEEPIIQNPEQDSIQDNPNTNKEDTNTNVDMESNSEEN